MPVRNLAYPRDSETTTDSMPHAGNESFYRELSMNNLGNTEHSNERNVAVAEFECDYPIGIP